MREKRQSADVQPAQPLPRTLLGLRTLAFMNACGAGLVLLAAGVAAQELGEPRLAWGGVAAVIFALRAAWLWSDTQRMAEQLPARPKRVGPSFWRRLWWWLSDHKPQPGARPEPFRRVKVGDDDEVLLPRQASEMRAEPEPLVPGLKYTASDVYHIVCAAQQHGLAERNWTFGERGMELPSGRRLSRDGYREVQAWLVQRAYADNKPYRLLVTPEAILEAL